MLACPGLIRSAPKAGILIRPGIVDPRVVITRSGATATALAGDNATFDTYAANTFRFNGAPRGLLIEGPRTNLFLNSAVLSTQGVTVTNVAHTLSFTGTGTITLSGASTAGPLVGTGINSKVRLVFTPTAGTLTCTVSGDVRAANLEIGSIASSWIVSTSVAATRNTELPSVSLPSLEVPATGISTIIVKFFVTDFNPVAAQSVIQIDDNSNNNRFYFRIAAGGAATNLGRVLAGTAANTASGAPSAGIIQTVAITLRGDGTAASSFNGNAAVDRTGGPTSGLATLRIGTNVSGEHLFGEIRSLRVLPYSVSNTTLAILSAT